MKSATRATAAKPTRQGLAFMIIIIITFCCALVVVFVAVAVTVALVVAGRCVLIVMLHNLPSAPQRQHRTESKKKTLQTRQKY